MYDCVLSLSCNTLQGEVQVYYLLVLTEAVLTMGHKILTII